MSPEAAVAAVGGATAAERYFRDLVGAYRRSVECSDEIAVDISVGPWPLTLRLAGHALAPLLLPPLERLRSRPRSAPLATICAFDGASTGVAAPPFPWRRSDVPPWGEIAAYNDARFRTIYHGNPADPLGSFHGLTMLDRHERQAVFWVSQSERISWYERAEPLRTAIHWVLTTETRFLAHASAVADDRGALLLAGPGGAGKSTTTLASLDVGLRFVGDNYVVVSLESEPAVYGLYGSAKVWPETLATLPGLAAAVRSFDVSGEDEKLVVEVGRGHRDRLASGMPVRAVVVPEVVGRGQARLEPCSPAAALFALAPTTVIQRPRDGSGMRGMGELVRRVPCFKLELGADVWDGPRELARLLQRLGTR